MAQFRTNVAISQDDPLVKVEVSRRDPLPLGPNRFQLVVVDDAGNESEPFILSVLVTDQEKPTAVLQVVNSDGKLLEPTVAFGSTFILSGAASRDTDPGTIREFRFTLLDRG